VARARELAGLPADARVGAADESPGLLQTLVDDEAETDPQRTGAVGALRAAVPSELTVFVSSIGPLASRELAICALPFALTVR
jgi:hypothetical protein